MGYLCILNFVILVPKGQGHIKSLTSDILAVTGNYWIYIFLFPVKLSFKQCIN